MPRFFRTLATLLVAFESGNHTSLANHRDEV